MRRALFTLATIALATPALAQDADLILVNGRIWTVNEAQPWAEGVAIDDGKIVAVGSGADAMRHRGPGTRVINLGGRFALPGFNDNHVHFGSAAAFYEFNIMRTSAQEDFVERVRDVVSRIDDGEWIVGGLWGAYDEWAEGSIGGERRARFTPDVSLVEAMTANNPMFVRRFDNSEYAVNRAALTQAGVDPDNPKYENIEFVKDEEGRFTGIVRGEVNALFRRHVPRSFSHERRVAQTKNALRMIAQAGVTNVSDMSDDTQLEIYHELHGKGELTTRIHFRPGLERWSELSARGVKVGSGDAWIRLGAVKGHIDGIMGTSGARFFEPYDTDPANRGSWRRLMHNEKGELDPGYFKNLMLEADAAGIQLTVHAIGDEANNLLLNFLDELNRVNGEKDRRFRLIHAQVLAPSDFVRLGPLGVVAEIQPFHLSDDMRWMEERIGFERCKGAYAFKSLADGGAVLSFGTDWPGTSAAEYPIDPMLGLYAAVTRQTVTGAPADGWYPEQVISIEDAIKAYTWGTAYANFEDDIKGTIEVGKLADITVLSKNLLEIEPKELLETTALYTIVDGRVVYQAP